MTDDQIKHILENSKIIAMIGVSSEKKGEDPRNLKRKPANVVMKYMQDFGYKIIPVNPFAKGEVINGETVVEEADIKYIENKCIKQEYQRLFLKSNPVFPVLKK